MAETPPVKKIRINSLNNSSANKNKNASIIMPDDMREHLALRKFLSASSLHSFGLTGKPACKIVVRIINGMLLRNHKLVREDLWIEGNRIINPQYRFWAAQLTGGADAADIIIDAKGSIVAAGYLDLQFNGAFGVDFTDSDVTRDDVDFVASNLVRYGVTGFLPTIVSSYRYIYDKVIPNIRPIEKKQSGNNKYHISSFSKSTSVHSSSKSTSPRNSRRIPMATNLGIHLEGPFISPKQKGAHEMAVLVEPQNGLASIMERYGNLDGVRIVTLAPELGLASDAIEGLKKNEATQAIKSGATMVTHLFNAMTSFHHRDPGIVGLLGSSENVFFGIIADGIHVHDYAISLAFGARPDRMVLVTDAMAAQGLPIGKHKLGNMVVDVSHDRAVLEGTDTLAGSIISLDQCVQRVVLNCGISKVQAIEAATLHPAQVLRIESRKGTLAFGTDADLIFLDPETLVVRQTFIDGVAVYRSQDWS